GILARKRRANLWPSHEVGQGDIAQKRVDPLRQPSPNDLIKCRGVLPSTAPILHKSDHLPYRDALRRAPETVTAARPWGALDQTCTPQATEYLLHIGHGYP